MTFQKAQGFNQLWYKETATTAVKADNNGFAARHAYLIPMKHIFGFCEDYDKIVYGFKHNLTLVRKQTTTHFLEEQQLMLEKSV